MGRTIAVKNPAMWYAGILDGLGAGTWESLELCPGKGLECSRESFTGPSGGSLEDQDAGRNPGSRGGPACEVSEGTKTPLGTGLETICVKF